MFVKRGISPLIATVLIIGFTIALGAVIILWGGGFIRGIQEKSDISAAKAETCAAALLKASGFDQSSPGTIDFLLENRGGVDVESVVVRVTGDSGIESVSIGRAVGSSAKKNFHINFDPAKVGVVSSVEILPKVDVAGKPEVCANGVEFESDRPSDSEVAQWDVACGNGNLDLEWEECDGDLFPVSPVDGATLDCASFGYPDGGNLVCSNFCTIDVSGCLGTTTCGNGVLDGEEGCDTINGVPDFYNTITDCNTLSSALGEPTVWSGSLFCAPDCMIDVSQCSRSGEIPESCGDDFVDAGEECDGADLAGQTCASQGFGSGDLSCNPDCTFNTGACVVCGNGVKEGTEQCDGADMGGNTCISNGFHMGSIGCNADCSLDTSGCSTIADIDAGWRDICALTTNGDVYCWGKDSGSSTYPSKVSISGVNKLSISFQHTCALTSTDMYCWGVGTSGQLGDGKTTSSSTPVKVNRTLMTKLPTVIATGETDTCAINPDGMYCWGANTDGLIGQGYRGQRRNPTLAGIPNARQVDVGDKHACAINVTSDGINKVHCAGWGIEGQLGNNNLAVQFDYRPVYPLYLANTQKVYLGGGSSSLAVNSAGAVMGWGRNLAAVLGVGHALQVNTPQKTDMAQLSNALMDMDSNGGNTCAINSAGELYCWGNNAFGSVGLGYTSQSGAYISRPARVSNMPNPTRVDVGSEYACALNASGVYCWGSSRAPNGSQLSLLPSRVAFSVCGDGIKEDPEECDGSDIGSVTCNDVNGYRFEGGALGCTPSCRFDVSGCGQQLCSSPCECRKYNGDSLCPAGKCVATACTQNSDCCAPLLCIFGECRLF